MFVPWEIMTPETWIITIVVLIIIFLIVREILCWYWKINKIVRILEDISSKLSPSFSYANQEMEEDTLESEAFITPDIASNINSQISGMTMCPHCKKPTLITRDRCEHCGRNIR